MKRNRITRSRMKQRQQRALRDVQRRKRLERTHNHPRKRAVSPQAARRTDDKLSVEASE
jgi:hypothetical protein